MTVTKLFVGGTAFDVTGEGYEPAGEVRESSSELRVVGSEISGKGLEILSDNSRLKIQNSELSQLQGLRQMLSAAVLCNGASLRQENGIWEVIGDPTEGALLVAAAKVGLTKETLEQSGPFEEELPFDADRKRMTIIRRTPAGFVAYVKGAPEVLLSRCAYRLTVDGKSEPLDDQQRKGILATNAKLAEQALRVLAAAYRHLDPSRETWEIESVENG